MSIKKRSHIPWKFLRFVKKASLITLMVFVVFFLNGGAMLLSALHFDTLADVMQTPRAQATTAGQMKLYFHKEPSDKNATYNALSLTPPEPGADTVSTLVSSVNVNANPPTALCESSDNTGETFNKVSASSTAVGIRCMASFISQPVGATLTIATGDAGAIAANLWIVDSSNSLVASTTIYLYKWDGTTLTRFKTLTSATDPGTSVTQVSYAAAAPDANVTVNPTDRIVAIVARNVTSAVSGSNVSILFDSTARAASSITLKYTTTVPNRPSLAGSSDDDFALDKATTACTTGGVVYNTKWTCLTGAATNSTGNINSEDLSNVSVAGDSSSWLWLQNKFSAAGTASNFGATPSNTYIYQAVPNGYGDGTVRTVINSTAAYTVGATNPATPYSHTGIVLWTSNTDYLEVQVYSTGVKSSANTVNVALNTNGTLSGVTSLDPATTSGFYGMVWVGFQKTGTNYQAQYSTDGTTWVNIGSAAAHATQFTRVGLNAYTGVAAVASTYSGAFEWFQYLFAAPVNNLTISATAGLMTTTVNSGDVSQYANTTACASAAACSAFTLSVNTATITVTSIKITQTGTANATSDLSNLALFYDTDGNYSNGVTGQYGSTVGSFTTGAATVNGSLALTAGTTYYFYVQYDAKSGTPTYPIGGQTVKFSIASTSDIVYTGSATPAGTPSLAGSAAMLPNATATTYGSGLADGGRSNESITVSGYGFGAAPGGSRANCAGAVNTGCVRFLVGGAATVADGDITAWSNTAITYTINPGLATFGGASAVDVVAGNQGTSVDLTFNIYPNVTGMAVCVTCGTNAAREYASGVDTDGLMMLQGDHFGSTAGTATFGGGFGALAGTIHATVEGPCTTGGWSAVGYSGNTVCVEVNPSISDSVYTGTVTVTRNSDSKTDYIDLRVLPRIISNAPTSAVIGATVQILGNHLCESGACPTAGNRSTVSDNVLFGVTQSPDADFLALSGGAGACNGAGAAWTHTEICVKVPAAAGTGSQPTKVTSNNSYTSNTGAFTVLSSVPNDPSVGPGTGKGQFLSDGTTAIGVGSTATTTTVVFKIVMTAGVSEPMEPQIELRSSTTSFSNAFTATGTAITGTTATGTVTVTGIADNTYHWQARVRNTATNEYSNWIAFNAGGNAFTIDTTAPTITFSPIDTCAGGQTALGTSTVTINWTINESADGQVEYGTDPNLVGSTNFPGTPDPAGLSHAIVLSGLTPGTTYYYRVKSRDGAGNLATRPSSNPYCTVGTSSGGYAATGDLYSAVFDTTGTSTGPAYNSIVWKGTLPALSRVRFQLATAPCSGGQTNYPACNDGIAWGAGASAYIGGSTCGTADWYDPGAADTAVEISCAPQYHNNMEYFRYRVQLCASNDCATSGPNTPVVQDVVVNWTP